MSQKNETTVLVISLLVTLALVADGVWWFTKINPPQPQSNDSTSTTATEPSSPTQLLEKRFSAGEQLLIPSDTTPEKEAGIKAIAAGNYEEAVAKLESSLKAQRNDPEALIYLNNARIGNQKSYTIATSMPIGKEVGAAKEMLRGVAQGQQEINQTVGISGVPLKVLIVNDDNNPEVAQKVAEDLVEYDLGSSNFNAANAVKQAMALDAEVLMLAPNSAYDFVPVK